MGFSHSQKCQGAAKAEETGGGCSGLNSPNLHCAMILLCTCLYSQFRSFFWKIHTVENSSLLSTTSTELFTIELHYMN